MNSFVKNINKKQKIKMQKLNPYFVTGFFDAESSFHIQIKKGSTTKTGWSVQLRFQINLHKKDKVLLEKVELYLGIGSITKKGKDAVQFQVSSIKDLEIIINHFDKYLLITQKWYDYQLFKMAFYLVKNKEHLTMKGLINIVAIKASMNKGLS